MFILLIGLPLSAQILPREDQTPEAGLEDLYDKFDNEQETKVEKQRKTKQQQEEEHLKSLDKDFTKISELVRLAPFEDIAVIQRRFLPKTKRFEFSGNGVISTNNAFFNNVGIGVRAGFYFTEVHGLELTYLYFTSAERPITDGLIKRQSIEAKSLVEPESFAGISYKWSPIYGKVAWFQQKIIPFDIYFTPGFGMSQTTGGGTEGTVSLGVGQLFALSKSFGIRWDFNWNYYQAEVLVDGQKQTRDHSDLFLGVGVSAFIPEATYR